MAFTIITRLPRDIAIQRLKTLLAREQSVCAAQGAIVDSTVTLTRIQRLGNSVFRPQFSGILVPTESGSVLRGDFRLPDSARSAIWIWFVAVGLWTCLSAVVWIRERFRDAWVLPLSGVAMAAFGLAFVCFAKRYYRSDRDWILRALKDELQGNLGT